MGMEQQVGGFEDKKVLLGNQMQAQLAVLAGKPIDVFIEEDAANFRSYLNSHDGILEEFESHPAETLNQIKKDLSLH